MENDVVDWEIKMAGIKASKSRMIEAMEFVAEQYPVYAK
jgi:hypothetical protein